jgi:hypothetical protein
MQAIDSLLETLNGGVLLIVTEHHDVEAYLLRIQNEGEASEDTDFSILTPTQCAEFAYYQPDPPIIDRRQEMPHNTYPDHPDFVRAWPGHDDWPRRKLEEITGLTIHHTLSDNPLGLFQWITRPQAQGGKGYPRGQYHYWVGRDQSAPIYHLLDDTIQCWHDHTGTYQTTLSIGMAGHLGYTRPPEEQLWKTVRLAWHLLLKYGLTIDDVAGHNDRYSRTVCPGWYADSPNTVPSGVWRRDFDIALQCCADAKDWPGYHA